MVMQITRVLVAEDEPETLAYVAASLRALGHEVVSSSDGVDALIQAQGGSFDAIILDRMLPGMDGLAIVRTLRAAGDWTPVLMLTALARIEDRVEGLEAGAHDYLVKPFAFPELKARLDALGRRSQGRGAETMLRAGEIEVDLLSRQVRRQGVAIDLQPREYALLVELLRNAGHVVTRTMLLERVWNFHFDPRTNIVETHISRLRTKLNAGHGQGHGRDPIQTVRGAGYMIAVGGADNAMDTDA
jgi:two-component system OmpR family response regulator